MFSYVLPRTLFGTPTHEKLTVELLRLLIHCNKCRTNLKYNCSNDSSKNMNFALFCPAHTRCEFIMQHCAVFSASALLAVTYFSLSDKTQQKHDTITKETGMF